MEKGIKIIDLKKNVLLSNQHEAEKLRNELKEQDIYYINFMSSPGSGKTSTLLQTISKCKHILRIGVMEADIDSDVDAKTIRAAGVPAVQLHTGGMCHLDADMSRQGLKELDIEELDVVFLENVGNLVCPAEFDTGATLNVAILSVPEGDDKPLKYPLMFQVCDVVIVNKIDALPVFDFSFERLKEALYGYNPDMKIFPISAKTGEGVEEWCAWLVNEVKKGMTKGD